MSKKVLIIDDDKVVRFALQHHLTQAGRFDVDAAATGEEGVAKAKDQKPDVVIVDTLLPGIKGPETCARIKKVLGKSSKVILTTGSISAVDAYKARKAGADDYVVKTSDFQFLVEAVKKMSVHGHA